MNFPEADSPPTPSTNQSTEGPSSGSLFSEWTRSETPEAHARLTPLEPLPPPPPSPEDEIETIPMRQRPNVIAAMTDRERKHGFSAKHWMVAVLHVQGATKEDIAEQIGYTLNNVDQVLARPSVRALIAEFQEQYGMRTAGRRLAGLAPKAIAVLETAIEGFTDIKSGERAKLQVAAAKDILDRVFPVVNVNVNSTEDLKALTDAELMARARGIN